MIVLDVKQGSIEWLSARLGLPTASEFNKIITSTGNASSQKAAFMHKLLAELITDSPLETFQKTEWMDRGNELESTAVSLYEFQNDIETETIGFCLHDDKIAGASPDRLVGEDGLLEIKCPAPQTHVDYLLKQKVDSNYIPQVQGQLWITGRKWCDWISYHPEMPPVIIRVERDEEFISKMDSALKKFSSDMEEKKQILQERGIL